MPDEVVDELVPKQITLTRGRTPGFVEIAMEYPEGAAFHAIHFRDLPDFIDEFVPELLMGKP